ncbi:uncharacterized protein LOC126272578 isoform X2 [Schistocerca gregaria]|uniref:uncharacterized protein LOC126272578 isoform X2 n=1 Tax=Schistocerca gregaria TaxID=7010 RepID=UPI00211ED9CC|nr:uncharacterized protein LOC126272578 isoform X2 [Schistocerca gregaria]
METGEGQDVPSWYCDSDSDDSIVVTISQMQDEAAKLQSTAAEIREELTGLLATLDDIEHRSTTEKRKKVTTKAKPESGDGLSDDCPTPEAACPAPLDAVDEGKEPVESDDRYRDVTSSATEPARRGSSGDMAASAAAAADPRPFDPSELIESLLDAVMERQSGAGDSLEAHRQHTTSSKDETQSSLKSCRWSEGQCSVGDVDASTHSSDSDDHDVVVSGERSSWDALERRRLRKPRRHGSEGSLSSDGRSCSAADDAAERTGADLELLDGAPGRCLFLE